jgi:hypothetical protein
VLHFCATPCFSKEEKQVIGATDNIQQSVVRNYGMWDVTRRKLRGCTNYRGRKPIQEPSTGFLCPTTKQVFDISYAVNHAASRSL